MSIACLCGGVLEGILIFSLLSGGTAGACFHRKKVARKKKESEEKTTISHKKN